ncbi:hypothetical protein TB2_021979 [Malus domestica]
MGKIVIPIAIIGRVLLICISFQPNAPNRRRPCGSKPEARDQEKGNMAHKDSSADIGSIPIRSGHLKQEIGRKQLDGGLGGWLGTHEGPFQKEEWQN